MEKRNYATIESKRVVYYGYEAWSHTGGDAQAEGFREQSVEEGIWA